MVDPISASIVAAAIAAAAGANAYAQDKAGKRMAKEDKKRTRADFTMDLLKQHLESQKATRKSQNERALSRTKALQNGANEFRSSLLGR